MDTITITDLEIWTRIGVPDAERTKEQRLLVSVCMHLDTKQAAAVDHIEHSIDYDKVVRHVQTLAIAERKTIERLAEDIADTIAAHYKPVRTDVTIKKFVIPGTKDIQLTISRP